MSSDDDDYEIGYGKPPKGNQFQKGQSGNSKGRPKGIRNFQTEIGKILRSKVTVTISGKQTKINTLTAALMRMREKALKGDHRALEYILANAEEQSSASDAHTRDRELSKLEKEILGRSGLFGEAGNANGPDDE